MVGELADEALIGKEVVLAGWVGRRRDLGGRHFHRPQGSLRYCTGSFQS